MRITGIPLSASSSVRDPALTALDARARGVLPGWSVKAIRSIGNGGVPVVILVPPDFDPSKPAIVQTHYHGDGTSAVGRNNQAISAMKELGKQNPQRIFILPEARANVNSAPTDWHNVKNQAQTTREALTAISVSNVGETTVSGHSAGGRALAYAMAQKDGLQADRLVLLDCLYYPAATEIAARFKQNPNIRRLVVVRGGLPQERSEDVARAFPGQVEALLAVGNMGGETRHFATIRFRLDGRVK